MRNKNQALEQAWAKITEYCRENFNDVFVKDTSFCVAHSPFHQTNIGITPDGTPYIDTKRISDSSSGEYFFHPYRKEGNYFIKYDRMEEVITDWQNVKAMLLKAKQKELSIYYFEV